MANLKKDKSRSARIVLPMNLKNKYDRSRYDFSGVDTKNGKTVKPKKIYTGKRGGKFVKYKGKKVYLRS